VSKQEEPLRCEDCGRVFLGVPGAYSMCTHCESHNLHDRAKIKTVLDLDEFEATILRQDGPGIHHWQDAIFTCVLRAIGSGEKDVDAQGLAERALRLADMDFDRWYE
jgi:hypothetical protein